MSTQIDFIKEYSEFIESTMLDEAAFLAKLPEYITDESVLIEPDSLFGHLVGFEGWNQWRRGAYDMAVSTGIQYQSSGSQFFENGETVLHYYEVEFSPRPSHPEGWRTSIIERYDFADGKIAKLTEYYADTTAFAAFFA